VSGGLPSFEEYVASLTPVSETAVGIDPETLEQCARATAGIVGALPLTRERLTALIRANPTVVPVVAAAASQSQERLRTFLQANFDTAGWVKLARERADELVARLDDEFSLITVLQAQAEREWTWADVLASSMASRQRAGSAVQQGRALEDDVESAIASLGLAFAPRGRFEGVAGRTAPVDFAIPAAGSETLIAVAVKGFDSTGSKLTDARREVEEMATVRKPRQFLFAIIDGHGWNRRKPDLRRIYDLWHSGQIDGLYNRVTLDAFQESLRSAARRLELL
jgi:hypothetical protein